MSDCDFEKIELSTQLMALATQIQSSINTNKDCRNPNENPSTITSMPSTTNWPSTPTNWPSSTTNWPSSTTNWPSTTTNWPSTTISPSTTSSQPIYRNYQYFTNNNNQSASSKECNNIAKKLLSIETPSEWVDLIVSLKSWYQSESMKPANGGPVLHWTEALLATDGIWRWADGRIVEFTYFPMSTETAYSNGGCLVVEYLQTAPEPTIQMRRMPCETKSIPYNGDEVSSIRALCESK